MDINSLVGLILGLTAIIGGQILEGGKFASLLQITAFIIVIGGTLGATLLQSTPKVFLQALKMLRWVFLPPAHRPQLIIDQIVEWSSIARKGGLLTLENQLEHTHDPFMRKGLQLLVDGAEPEIIRNTLDIEINSYEEHYRAATKVWEAAGGYAPTIGILGAVLGLIHVMENLSDPSKLGAGIAVAFVATVYGVGSANLFYLPVANKLKMLVNQEITNRDLYIDGLISIANGENPRLIETKLQGYLI